MSKVKLKKQYCKDYSTQFSTLLIIGLIFYISTYWLVSSQLPSTVPVHHDDYTNYASGLNTWTWTWIRPLSTALIHVLALFGQQWLIWGVRLLCLSFVFLSWNLLCEIVRPRQYWFILTIFALTTFATPISAEYTRYTGMITHLLSGCLGLGATLFLLRASKQGSMVYLGLSVVLLGLSALAKEDFIPLYGIAVVYAATSGPIRKQIILVGIGALAGCGLLIGGAKFLAASSFLGAVDVNAPYHINVAPISVLTTMWRYLIGAGHPAMITHGYLIASIFIFSALSALLITLRHYKLPKTAYLLASTLSVMLPYSLLPNHVNAYYELIWLPLLVGSLYVAMVELLASFFVAAEQRNTNWSTLGFLLFALALIINDYPYRRNIAAWYDEIGTANQIALQKLTSQKERINQTKDICIVGANSFSPWYMHSGEYLANVLNLRTTWHIVVATTSPLYAGLASGAASSSGRIKLIVPDAPQLEYCHTINLKIFK